MKYEAILAVALMCVILAATYFFDSYKKLFRRPRSGSHQPGKAKRLGA